ERSSENGGWFASRVASGNFDLLTSRTSRGNLPMHGLQQSFMRQMCSLHQTEGRAAAFYLSDLQWKMSSCRESREEKNVYGRIAAHSENAFHGAQRTFIHSGMIRVRFPELTHLRRTDWPIARRASGARRNGKSISRRA